MTARVFSRMCVTTGVLLAVGGTSVVAVGLATQPVTQPAAARVTAPAGSAPAWSVLHGAPERLPARERPADSATPASAVRSGAPASTVPIPVATPPPAVPVASAAPLAAAEPVLLEIPAIGVHSRVYPIGLNEDGTIAVPAPGPRYDSAAWYRYSPTPGEIGPAIVEGHLDSPTGEPSVFYRLGELRPGDDVNVDRADGTRAVFRVTEVGQYPKTQFPTSTVYGDLDHAGLRVITCAGGIDAATRHYLDNVVVFATLVRSGPTPAN